MRLTSRWTKEEIEYLESTSMAPVTLFNEDGRDNQYLPISYIQKMTKLWRKEIVENNNKVMSLEELDHVEALLKSSKTKKNEPENRNNVEPMATDEENKPQEVHEWATQDEFNLYKDDMQCHFVSTELVADLPTLKVSFQSKDGSYMGSLCCPDTGSQISLMSLMMFKKLGFETQDLNTTRKLSVATASGAGNLAKGTKEFKMYIHGDDNNQYYVMVNFVIFDGPVNRILLGRPALVGSGHKWECKNRVESITLDVFDHLNKKRRKKFLTSSNESSTGSRVYNVDCIDVGPEPVHCKFACDSPFDVSRFRFSSKIDGLKIWSDGTEMETVVSEDVIGLQRWPGQMNLSCLLTITSPVKRQLSPLALNVHAHFNEELKAAKSELNTHPYQDEELPTFDENYGEDIPTLGPVDAETLDKIAVCPSEEDTPDGEKWYLPDMDHVPPDVKERFEKLFYEFRHVFSRGKFDISRARVPAVSITTLPGHIASDKCARHTEEESLIIQEYLDEMIASGQIEELHTHDEAKFNHRLLLVYRQDPSTGKKFVSSKADQLKGSARIEALKKSSRLVSDMKSLNDITVTTGRMHLPQLKEILPLMSERMVSVTDVRSGFSNILIDRESSLKTAFVHRDKKYVYLVLPQGLKISPERFQNRVAMVLNQTTFNEFLRETECSLKLKYFSSLLVYQDDLAMLGTDYNQHYVIWNYVLYSFSKYGFKLNAKKTSFLKPKVDFLGFEVRPKTGQYSLTSERKSAFKSWAFRPERQYIVSRLCTLNYFQNCIVGFRQITTCLHLLCKQKVFHVKRVHALEWAMMRLILDLDFTFHIPDMNKPLIICSDASFSCAAGAVMQYDPGNNENESNMRLCSVITKQFSSQDLAKSIVFKELMSLIHCIEANKHWIRSCHRQVIVFTDASSLQFLHRLKDSNSRIYHFSLLLSSYDNLHIFWTKGSFLNAIADNLSRCMAGMKINDVAALPAKYVENLPPIHLSNVIITPEVVHAICQQKLPGHFSDVPARHRQQYAPMKTEKEMMDLLESAPPEKQILDAIYFGYGAIKSDSTVFMNEQTNKIMSKTDFNNLASKLKFQNIKDELDRISCESYHVEESVVIEEKINLFVKNLHDCLVRENLRLEESTLFNATKSYLHNGYYDAEKFHEILNVYHNSSLYNTSSDVEQRLPTLFIQIGVHTDSVVNWCVLNDDENKNITTTKTLVAYPKKDILLPPKTVMIVKLKTVVKSKHSVVCAPTLPDQCIGEIVSQLSGINVNLMYLLIRNKSEKEIIISHSESIANLIVHIIEEKPCTCEKSVCTCNKCSCSAYRDICFVINDVDIYDNDIHLTDLRVLFTHALEAIPYTSSVLEVESEDPSVENEKESTEEESATVLTPDKETIPASPTLINQLILSGIMLFQDQIFTADVIRDLQRSSEFLSAISAKLKLEPVKGFFFDRNKILMYQNEKDDKPRICLDDVTTKMMLRSLHQRDYHLTDDTSMHHYNSHFYNKHIKAIVKEVKNECSVCFFNQPCRRQTYVNQPRETEPYKVMEKIHCDCIENLPTSVDGYRFILLFVDVSSGYVVAEAARNLTASEITKITDRFFRYFGTPSIIKTDFGPCFRSHQYRQLLKDMEVKHEKSCPRRPESNGLVEIIVRNYREALTKVIMSNGYEKRNRWTEYLSKTSLFFNNAPLHQKLNKLSRLNLFFNSNRFNRPSLYNVNDTDEMLTCLQQQKALHRIWEARERSRENYNTQENPYSRGMLTCVPLAKDENEIIPKGKNGGRGLQPTVNDIKVVSDIISPTSCQLKSRYTGTLQTYDIKDIRPINLNELSFCFGKDLLDPSSFDNNLYRQGTATTILAKIKDLEETDKIEHSDTTTEDVDNVDSPLQTLEPSLESTSNLSTNENTAETPIEEHTEPINRTLRPRENLLRPLRYRTYHVNCPLKSILKPIRSYEKRKYNSSPIFSCRRHTANDVSIIPNIHLSFQHFKEINLINSTVPPNIKCKSGNFNVPMTFEQKKYVSFFTKSFFEPCLTGAELKLL